MELKSLEDTKLLSEKISKIVNAGDAIFLYGDIGVGKTTFVRGLINNLEIQKRINKSQILSPTFNIVYEYNIGNIKIVHYDLYRLKKYKDILELGMFDTSKDYIKIVEWPELIELKPKDRIDLLFEYTKLKDIRQVKINGFGKWKDYKFNEI